MLLRYIRQNQAEMLRYITVQKAYFFQISFNILHKYILKFKYVLHADKHCAFSIINQNVIYIPKMRKSTGKENYRNCKILKLETLSTFDTIYSNAKKITILKLLTP